MVCGKLPWLDIWCLRNWIALKRTFLDGDLLKAPRSGKTSYIPGKYQAVLHQKWPPSSYIPKPTFHLAGKKIVSFIEALNPKNYQLYKIWRFLFQSGGARGRVVRELKSDFRFCMELPYISVNTNFPPVRHYSTTTIYNYVLISIRLTTWLRMSPDSSWLLMVSVVVEMCYLGGRDICLVTPLCIKYWILRTEKFTEALKYMMYLRSAPNINTLYCIQGVGKKNVVYPLDAFQYGQNTYFLPPDTYPTGKIRFFYPPLVKQHHIWAKQGKIRVSNNYHTTEYKYLHWMST